MLRFLTNLLITTGCSAIGFIVGMIYMRDNYIRLIEQLEKENEELRAGIL